MRNLILAIFLFSFVACGECDDETICPEVFTLLETLVIGITFGECGGDCAHFIKIEGQQVFLDDEDGYFFGETIPKFKKEKVEDEAIITEAIALRADFPNFLVETNETSFGCPDCGDWGALPTFKDVGGEIRYWQLDNQNKSNPEEIQAWVERVQAVLAKAFFN